MDRPVVVSIVSHGTTALYEPAVEPEGLRGPPNATDPGERTPIARAAIAWKETFRA